jgi:hypothetical protein
MEKSAERLNVPAEVVAKDPGLKKLADQGYRFVQMGPNRKTRRATATLKRRGVL